jgi:hypothetical protein
MGEEAERNVPFVLSLAEMLPRLNLHTLEARPLEDGVYHIDLVVENTGFFPSYTSNQGKKRNANRPVRAELTLPEGALLLQGKVKTEIGISRGAATRLRLASAQPAQTTVGC